MAEIESNAAAQVQSRVVGAGRGWDWIAEGFGLFKKQAGMWILLVIIMAIICVIPVAGWIVAALLLPLFGAGFMLGCRVQDTGGNLEISHLFAGFKAHTGNLVLLGVFMLIGHIAILAIAVPIVGTATFFTLLEGNIARADSSFTSILIALLLVLSAGTFLYMAMWFAPALVMFQNLSTLQALKASFVACLKNVIPFTVYGIVLTVFAIVAAIPSGLGLLVLSGLINLALTPVVITSIYTGYRDIFTG